MELAKGVKRDTHYDRYIIFLSVKIAKRVKIKIMNITGILKEIFIIKDK